VEGAAADSIDTTSSHWRHSPDTSRSRSGRLPRATQEALMLAPKGIQRGRLLGRRRPERLPNTFQGFAHYVSVCLGLQPSRLVCFERRWTGACHPEKVAAANREERFPAAIDSRASSRSDPSKTSCVTSINRTLATRHLNALPIPSKSTRFWKFVGKHSRAGYPFGI